MASACCGRWQAWAGRQGQSSSVDLASPRRAGCRSRPPAPHALPSATGPIATSPLGPPAQPVHYHTSPPPPHLVLLLRRQLALLAARAVLAPLALARPCVGAAAAHRGLHRRQAQPLPLLGDLWRRGAGASRKQSATGQQAAESLQETLQWRSSCCDSGEAQPWPQQASRRRPSPTPAGGSTSAPASKALQSLSSLVMWRSM